MKNKILAILAAPAAIPPKPNIPAIIANMIKVTVQRNIVYCFKVNNLEEASCLTRFHYKFPKMSLRGLMLSR